MHIKKNSDKKKDCFSDEIRTIFVIPDVVVIIMLVNC